MIDECKFRTTKQPNNPPSHYCPSIERTEIVRNMPDVWDDTIDYFFTIDGDNRLLTRRKCSDLNCRRKTQLELCTKHLLEAGLQVKESQIPGSGWGLYTTRDRGKGETISYFTGVETESVGFTGLSEYVAWRGGGFIIDSSIERCSAACANTADAANAVKTVKRPVKNNCDIITYRRKCYIKTKEIISRGDEIFIPYGRRYRWK